MSVQRFQLKTQSNEYEQVKRYLDGLSQKALARPIACDGWEVRDVLGYLDWLDIQRGL